MKIDNEFEVSVPIERAWQVLTDLRNVAPCMPGAKLTGVEDGIYSGQMRVKVGPVISEYAGTAQFVDKDDATHHAVIDAKGRDKRGAGNASAAIDARCEPLGERTRVIVSTDMKITGKIAQLGSGMIKEVSTKLLGQFVENLEARLAQPEPTAESEPDAVQPPEPEPAGSQPAMSEQAMSEPAMSQPADPRGAQPNGASSRSSAPAMLATAPAAVIEDDPEPLDLLAVAGGSLTKRLVPLAAAALVVVVAVVTYLRRR